MRRSAQRVEKVALAALRSSWNQRVLSSSILLVAAATVSLATLSAAQSVAAVRAVLDRVDDRDILHLQVVDDTGEAGLDTSAVRRLQALSHVEWVIGVGPAEDVYPVGLTGGVPVAAREVVGDVEVLGIPAGVHPRPSCFAGTDTLDRLGFAAAAGAVEAADGWTCPVLGRFRDAELQTDLGDQVLVRGNGSDGPIRRVHLLVDEPANVLVVAAAVQDVVGDVDGERPRVVAAEDLAGLRPLLQGELVDQGRRAVLVAMAAGLVVSAITIHAGTSARSRDFGRQRALGASRRQLAATVVLQVAVPGTAGALIGCVVGTAVAWQMTGQSLGWRFPLGVAILILLTMAAGSLPSAVRVAWIDPVAALRMA